MTPRSSSPIQSTFLNSFNRCYELDTPTMFRLRREYLNRRLIVVSVLTGVSVVCCWFMVAWVSSVDLQKDIPKQETNARIQQLEQRIQRLESEIRRVKHENSALKQNVDLGKKRGKKTASDRGAKVLTGPSHNQEMASF